MKIKSVVNRDFKLHQANMLGLFAWRKKRIAEALQDFQHNVLRLIAFHLSNMPAVTYSNFLAQRLDRVIVDEIDKQLKIVEARILPEWQTLRRQMDLSGRLFIGFIARKNTPPWLPVKLDIGSAPKTLDRFEKDLPYRLKHLEAEIMKAVHMAVHAEEPVHQALNRVKKIFNSQRRRSMEKDYRPQMYKDAEDMNEQYNQSSWEASAKLGGGVDMTEGFYTMADVQRLKDEQAEAMGWYYRDYSPDMDEAIWARNVALMSIEQDLMRDAIQRLHSGELQIGSENLGIDDFQWITSKPQKECDECCQRDEMTMTEIKDTFGTGSFPRGAHVWPPELKQDSPPALHPHCACRLVPKIKDDWADETLEKNGTKWDDVSGDFYQPGEQEQRFGFTRMSYDQWIKNIGEPNVQAKAQ